MLVLSRREQQQIVFPNLGIQVSVIQVRGRLVKLGVEAPDSVKVLRKELMEYADAHKGVDAPSAGALDHQRRNELNLLHLRLEALRSRLARGEEIDAQRALDSLLGKFSSIDHAVRSAHQSRGADHPRPIRLLVVEDSDNERQLMAYLLASQGIDVCVACDGLAALEQLHAADAQPDFILMDMQMPHSDGLETLLQIRTDDRLKRLKVFAVTGVARDPSYEPASGGWDGWFQKPLDVGSLVQRLRAECAQKAPQLAV